MAKGAARGSRISHIVSRHVKCEFKLCVAGIFLGMRDAGLAP